MTDSQFWFLLLSVLSSLLLLVTLFILEFDLLSPIIATQLSLTVASILCTTMVNKWQLPMHGDTVVILITVQIIMTVSALYTTYCLNNKLIVGTRLDAQNTNNLYIPISRQIIIWLLLFIVIILAGQEIYNLAIKLQYKDGLLGMATFLRPYFMDESSDIKLSREIAYYQIFVQQVTYLSIYIFIRKLIFQRWQWSNLSYLVPLVFFFPFVYLTTGRILIIMLIIFIFTVIGNSTYRKYRGGSYIKSLFITASVSFFIFLLLFVIVGSFLGKGISENTSIFDIFAHYAGISLSAFDVILQYKMSDSTLIGHTLFIGPYGNLNTIGFNLPKPSVFLFFTYFYQIDTNVYTSLMRYYLDFSMVGMYLMSVLIISVYTVFYYICRQKNSILMILFYATFVYPLYLFYIDDRIFIDFFGTQLIYVVILQYVLMKILVKDKY